ncbi:MAG: hypothetical protein MI810_15305 [Flavobacteriales bacterium]|nr:hypothetical protein [Flavobacteriales bacterium]
MSNNKFKSPINVEEKLKSKSGFSKFLLITGGVFFVAQIALLLLHLGFAPDNGSNTVPITDFLSTQTLWIVNLSLGLVGAILLEYKRIVASIISGLAASVAITGGGILYFDWRVSVLQVEIIVPLLFGLIVGGLVYKLLKKALYKEPKEEEYNY